MDSMGLISCISKPYVNCGQSSMLLATILCGLVDNLHKAHWEGANIGINNGTT